MTDLTNISNEELIKEVVKRGASILAAVMDGIGEGGVGEAPVVGITSVDGIGEGGVGEAPVTIQP